MRPRVKVLWLVLFLLPVIWQLWVPPYTGLADNGDFAKVLGGLSLGPSVASEQDTFHFFIREWKRDPKFYWESSYWGVESWLTRLAVWIGGDAPFDTRWLGLVHAILFALVAWQCIGLRWPARILALLALTDAAYVTYFQSFYFDAAALLFYLMLLFCWRQGAGLPLLTLAAAGFALSKAPHAPAALMLGSVMFFEGKRRMLVPGLALILGGCFLLNRTQPEYKATAYYNLIFSKLALIDEGSLEAMQVRAEDRRLVGTNAFEQKSPAQNTRWLVEFYPNAGYGKVLRYYLHHPTVAMQVLYGDLRDEAKEIRALNLGNYERSTGKRYCTLSPAFGWYSAAKSWLFEVAPWHVFVLFPLASWWIWRGGRHRLLLLGVLLTAGYEFGLAALADACETHRHLLLFHASYDVLLVLALSVETQSKHSASVS